jgi:undecaprenyl-diphosphatase
MAAVTFFGLLAYLLAPKMRSAFGKVCVVGLAILIMLFIGFTRVFTAAHYFTDVLAGYAMGIAWFGVVYTLVEKYFLRRKVIHANKD